MSRFTHLCENILAKKSCCAEIYRLLGLWGGVGWRGKGGGLRVGEGEGGVGGHIVFNLLPLLQLLGDLPVFS